MPPTNGPSKKGIPMVDEARASYAPNFSGGTISDMINGVIANRPALQAGSRMSH